MKWDIVATVKEPPEVIENFVAHHILMGVNRIWLFFDDPEDPSIERLGALEAVEAVRCDADFWADRGGVPRTIERKQMRNARSAYEASSADWIIHIDSDEFVETDRPLGQILAETTGPVLRLSPYEMLHFVRSGQTAEPTHIFRGPLPHTQEGFAIAEAAYGPFDKVLRRGMLSHIAGKFFVRTGVEGMSLRIHVPEIDGVRVGGVTAEDARLLHLHGGDWDEWRQKMQMRLQKGAYTAKHDQRKSLRFGKETTINYVLQDLLATEGEDGLRRFYARVCAFDRTKRALRQVGALHRTSMWLAQKRDAVFGRPSSFMDMRLSPETGALEAVVEVDGTLFLIEPDATVAERELALRLWRESPGASAVLARIATRKTAYFRIGGPAPVTALKACSAVDPGSISFFVANGATQARKLKESLKLNGIPTWRAHVIVDEDDAPLSALASDAQAVQAMTSEKLAPFERTVLEVELPDLDPGAVDTLEKIVSDSRIEVVYLTLPASAASQELAARLCANGRYLAEGDGVLMRVA